MLVGAAEAYALEAEGAGGDFGCFADAFDLGTGAQETWVGAGGPGAGAVAEAKQADGSYRAAALVLDCYPVECCQPACVGVWRLDGWARRDQRLGFGGVGRGGVVEYVARACLDTWPPLP